MSIYRYPAVPAATFSNGFHIGKTIQRADVQALIDAAETFCRQRWTYSCSFSSAWTGSSATLRWVLPILYSGWGQMRINGGYSSASGGVAHFREWFSSISKASSSMTYNSASYWPTTTDALSSWWASVQTLPFVPSDRPEFWEVALVGVSFSGPFGLTAYQTPVFPDNDKVFVDYDSDNLRQVPALAALPDSQDAYDVRILQVVERMIGAAARSPIVLGALPAVTNVSGPLYNGSYWTDAAIRQVFSRWIPRSQLIYDDNCALWVAVDGDPSYGIEVYIGGQAIANVRNSYAYSYSDGAGKCWYIVPLDAQRILGGLNTELIYCTVVATKVAQMSMWIAGYPGPDDVE